MNDEIILNTCLLSNGNIKNIIVTNKYLESHPVLKSYLFNRYNDIPSDLFSYREVIWRIKNNISKRPTCKTCGRNVNFIGKSSWDKIGKTENGYLLFCSPSCAQNDKDVRNKIKSTNIDKYGTECSLQNNEVLKKSKKTMLKKYGVKNALENKSLLEKAKRKIINTLGVYPPSKSSEIKEKTRTTNIKKYGGPAPACNDKIMSKIKKTNLKKYGSEAFLTSEGFSILRDKFSSEWYDKRLDSILKNGNINHSIPEDKMLSFLINIFGGEDVVHQYKSEKYPFVCDFYIQSIDLYIEYQGTYFHNLCFYNHNIDAKRYDELLSKCSDEHPSYKRIVKTWVFDDVEKFNTAVNNNLNMLFIYPYWSKEWVNLLKRKNVVNENKIINELKQAIYNCINNSKQLIIGEKR